MKIRMARCIVVFSLQLRVISFGESLSFYHVRLLVLIFFGVRTSGRIAEPPELQHNFSSYRTSLLSLFVGKSSP